MYEKHFLLFTLLLLLNQCWSHDSNLNGCSLTQNFGTDYHVTDMAAKVTSQGPPGKRGPQGVPGDIGEKGEKVCIVHNDNLYYHS